MPDTTSRVMSTWKLGLETIAFLVFYVGAVAAGIPALLMWWADRRLALGLGNVRYIGLVPLIVGICCYLYCATYLAAKGRGVPAPVDPTRRLIACGPYAIVRNPMYVAGACYFWGLAVLFDSGVLLAYALVITTAYYVGVVYLEEPTLVRRFGPSFSDYCRRTPRWLPSLQTGLR
jgi:protein-S-isoprenylcysteine O-methyltransferase Ste14